MRYGYRWTRAQKFLFNFALHTTENIVFYAIRLLISKPARRKKPYYLKWFLVYFCHKRIYLVKKRSFHKSQSGHLEVFRLGPCSQEGSPTISSLPLQGHLQTPSFQLSEPYWILPKPAGSLPKPASRFRQTAKTQSAGAGGKAQAVARHCAEF